MISKSSVLVLVLVASVATAFRAPENPTAVKIPIKKTVGTVVDIKPPEDVVISSDTLTQVGKSVAAEKFIKSRHAEDRKKWGVDNANDCEYWYDSRIHTLGNIGFLGAVHAALAPLSTKIIDDVAYEGLDVRAFVAEQLSNQVQSSKAKVLDLCCGVGISTRALKDAFPESEFVVGVDTSNEMITMANFLSSHLGFFKPIVELFKSIISIKKPLNFKRQRLCRPVFSQGNAEQTEFPGQSFDLVTIMYAFHEAPKEGRERILQEAYRVLQPGGTLAVVDICTDYKPSKAMLAGEPYVLEYQKNIHRQLRSMRGFSKVRYETIVPEHVGMWILKRSTLEL